MRDLLASPPHPDVFAILQILFSKNAFAYTAKCIELDELVFYLEHFDENGEFPSKQIIADGASQNVERMLDEMKNDLLKDLNPAVALPELSSLMNSDADNINPYAAYLSQRAELIQEDQGMISKSDCTEFLQSLQSQSANLRDLEPGSSDSLENQTYPFDGENSSSLS